MKNGMRRLIACALALISVSAYAEVLQVNIWDPMPGKAALTIQNGQTARQIHTRLGANVTINLDRLGRMHYVVTFESWAEWAAFAEKLQASKEWLEWWAGAQADPSAELVQVYLLESID